MLVPLTGALSDWSVVGLLSNEPTRIGHELRGVRLGIIDDLPKWAGELSVFKAILAMPEASAIERRHAIEAAVQAGLSVLTVPSLEDMLAGKVAISQILVKYNWKISTGC